MNLRNALKTLGWSQAELAARLGILQSTVSAWRNEPPGYARAYLELALQMKALSDAASASLERMKR